MKKFLSFAVIAFTVFGLASCDKNAGKAKEIAEQFVKAYNEGDKAGVYELFTLSRDYSYLSMSGQLKNDDMSADYDEEKDVYTVTLDEEATQRLVFKADSLGNVHIIDSYGVFKLDTLYTELGLKTGVPLKQLSDGELAVLFDEKETFMNFLKQKNNLAYGGKIVPTYGGRWHLTNSILNCVIGVQNNGTEAVSGKDYYLEVEFSKNFTKLGTKTVDGVDLAAGELHEITFEASEYRNVAREQALNWYTTVKFRGQSQAEILLKYGTFTGEEYKDYAENKEKYEGEFLGSPATLKSDNEDVVYAHADSTASSKVVDTLYHRMSIMVRRFENSEWVKVWSEGFKPLGYIPVKNYCATELLSPVSMEEMTVKNESGEVKVYKAQDVDSEVVKTVKSGTRVHIIHGDLTNEHSEMDGDYMFLGLVEIQPNGALKQIGYIWSDDIAWGE